jgi:hypothetical protein
MKLSTLSSIVAAVINLILLYLSLDDEIDSGRNYALPENDFSFYIFLFVLFGNQKLVFLIGQHIQDRVGTEIPFIDGKNFCYTHM